jgi:hypothetical protein
MSSLADWAESVFAVVEQDGACVHRVQVVTPVTGDIWHTWTAPFPPPDEWAIRAEGVLRNLAEESSGRTSVTFVALEREGATLHQLPWKIQGKKSGGNLESVQQATASVFASMTQTLERSGELTQTQLVNARQHMETLQGFIGQQQQLINAYRGREAMGDDGQPASPVAALLEQYGPQIGQAISMLVTMAAHHFAQGPTKPAVKRVEASPAQAEPEQEISDPRPAARSKGKARRRPPEQTIKQR